MRVVELPSRATITESYQLIETCASLEQEPQAVQLDCGPTTRFGPFGVALIAACIAVRQIEGRATELKLPNDRRAKEFASEIGLARFASGQRTGIGTLEVRQMRTLDAIYTEAVTSMLLRGVPGMTEENSYVIQLCLNELLQNVFEWAESPIGCTVLARWYLRTRSVRLAVVDRGIGIPAALRRKQVQDLHKATDADVIEAAFTRPRLTSRENRVGGLGLKTIHEKVNERGGRLTVVSHSAKLTWTGGKLMRARSVPMKGTGIEIDIRPGEFEPFEPAPMVF